MFVLLGALGFGGCAGYASPLERTHSLANGLVYVGLVVLLFAMGIRIGTDGGLLGDLRTIGTSAVGICLGAVFGSIACVGLVTAVISFGTGPNGEPAGRQSPGSVAGGRNAAGIEWGLIAMVFGALLAGLGLGLAGLPEALVAGLPSIADVALLGLLFGVGVAVGADTTALGYVADLGWRILLVPVAVGVGSVLGGLAVGLALDVPLSHASAVAAGFGWYSYAGVIVFEQGYHQLAAIAFVANLLREVVTFLVLPATVRYLGGLAAIAPGGATTMDVTLPMIQRVAGEEFVVPALVNGIVLSVAATLLVPLFLAL